MINTKCEKCIFKIVEDSVQIGCQQNIYKNIENLQNIYPSNTINKNGNTWVINNYYCRYARIAEWVKALEEKEIDPKEQLLKETTIPYQLFQYVDENNIKNIATISKDINEAQFKPNIVVFAYKKSENQNVSKDLVKSLEDMSLGFKWKLIHILEEKMSFIDSMNFAAQNNIKLEDVIIMSKNSIDTNTIDSINYIFQNTANKKIIVSKNLNKDTDDFDILCFPGALWRVSNSNIYNALDIIEDDLEKIEDFYNVELI